MAESISEGTLKQFSKAVGDYVEQDEEIATIETDKIDISVNAPQAGTIQEFLAKEEETVTVGQSLVRLGNEKSKPDKIDVSVNAPAGTIQEFLPKEEDTATVGKGLVRLCNEKSKLETAQTQDIQPAASPEPTSKKDLHKEERPQTKQLGGQESGLEGRGERRVSR